LSARAERVGVATTTETRDRLEEYLGLLARWNRRINLTGLPLDPPTAATIDRLLIEPLVAAVWARTPLDWYDVGSGSGSPAIPFKIVHSQAKLTMVESRSRKAAFLREAVRTIGLSDTGVECARVEDVAGSGGRLGTSDLITMRGVKPDAPMWGALQGLLSQSGKLFWFHSRRAVSDPVGFSRVAIRNLGTSDDAVLTICKPALFHVEQER
jgi:16S rRNA (guanine527-N7)-methyltransferase